MTSIHSSAALALFPVQALLRVPPAAEVFLAMCTHALTTEAEEIMGLLLGDIRVSGSWLAFLRTKCSSWWPGHSPTAHPCTQAGDGNTLVAYIRRAIPQIRTDRRKVIHTIARTCMYADCLPSWH